MPRLIIIIIISSSISIINHQDCFKYMRRKLKSLYFITVCEYKQKHGGSYSALIFAVAIRHGRSPLWLGTCQQLDKLSQEDKLPRLIDDVLQLATVVKNLGVYRDSGRQRQCVGTLLSQAPITSTSRFCRCQQRAYVCSCFDFVSFGFGNNPHAAAEHNQH